MLGTKRKSVKVDPLKETCTISRKLRNKPRLIRIELVVSPDRYPTIACALDNHRAQNPEAKVLLDLLEAANKKSR